MANPETYSKLFDNIIENIKMRGLKNSEALCRLVESSRNSILKIYTEINTISKKLYMKHPDGLLDRHKCAACFIIAFIKGLLIGSDKISQDVYENYREKLALIAGLSVMKTLIVGNRKDANNADFVTFIENKNFLYPDLLCDMPPPSYEEIWVFELRNSYRYRRLSVLQLAHELFLIEYHNRFIAKYESARDFV